MRAIATATVLICMRELTQIHRDVAAARAGTEPRVLARVPSGWVLFGAQQFVRGYALLLPDPVVPDLNALESLARAQFLGDMGRVGDALLRATGAVRINYAIFGNVEPALHAHVVPRYADEPDEMRTAHPWMYDWSRAPAFNVEEGARLRDAVRRALASGPDRGPPRPRQRGDGGDPGEPLGRAP